MLTLNTKSTNCFSNYIPMFVLHLAPAVSVLQLLKFGTLSLRLFECVPAMIPFAINSRATTSSWPSNLLSASSLAPQIRLWLTIVRVYKLYLLTYLLTYLQHKSRFFSFIRHGAAVFHCCPCERCAVYSDIDECAVNNGECHSNAVCFNTMGTYCCVCVDGYYGSGFECTGKGS